MDRRNAEGMRDLVETGLKRLRRPPTCLQHARNGEGLGPVPSASTYQTKLANLRNFPSTRGSMMVGGDRARPLS